MDSKKIKMILFAVIMVTILVTVIKTVGIVKIEGDEAGIRQNLWKGVLPDVWLSGTKFYCGWITDVYKYDIGTQKITFAGRDTKDAEYDRIKVNLGENGGQSAWISLSANYRIGWVEKDSVPVFNSEKLVALHKDGLRTTYEDVVIKRTIIDVINTIARPRKALEIYSGVGFVKFKDDVALDLKNHPVFKQRGIFIENVIVYQVELEPKYEAEIEAKQLAIQTKLRKIEETKSAEEEARRAFAAAQAEVETRRQQAEAKKIERVKEAEAEKAEIVLQAEAEKEKRIKEAEGERDANIARAEGELAVGIVRAKVETLKREALYAGESGKRRAEVTIAEKQAEKLSGMLKGVRVITDKTMQILTDSSAKGIGITVTNE